ncbi:inositol monophosphatase [Pelagibacteraceae bacterium]|nr:inositol monophosphatase [Pelagibacteraceae bacterium]
MPLLSPEINILEKVCIKASKIIIRDFGEIEKLQVSKKGPGDFVTKTDQKVEEIIIEELERARPGYNFVAEEGGSTKENKSEFTWIIDPIDGTNNFLHGIPHFAISIGLEKNNEIIAGIIFDPIKNEMFFAEKGRGAYLNNSRIRVSSRNIIADSIALTGGPSYAEPNKDIFFEEYIAMSNNFNQVRKLGSAALDLAYVAAGRAEIFWHKNLKYWDIAAGLIIVREAGGTITDFRGKTFDLTNNQLLATNSRLDTETNKILSSIR